MESVISVYRPMPRQFIIAREGFPFIGIALIGAAALWAVGLPSGSALMLCIAGFVAYFFRNPERSIPEGEGLVVAPADGRVIAVENDVLAPVTGHPATKISIFMSVLNVHINRFPVAGRVKRTSYHAGRFLVASVDKASEQNERHAIHLEDDAGRNIVLVQIAGLIARRIVCYLREGDSLGRGERYGLIRFGSRVDIYLPPGTKVETRVGERTRAGESVIGRFS